MIKASIIGATGFTGAILTDLLSQHPEVRLDALTSTTYRGRRLDDVFPRLRLESEYEYEAYAPERVADSDVVFVCYPHAQSYPVVTELVDAGHRVIDFSADFRLRDPALYPDWYRFDHPRPDLLGETAYGLPEIHRAEIVEARVVANPGCYPTGFLLAVLPLAERYPLTCVIDDASSGLSGAGRAANERTHFCSVQDNFRTYSEVGHRHTAEMAQELGGILGGAEVAFSFTPHLLPVDRGILSTVYCLLADPPADFLPDELLELYVERYRDEPFVEVRKTPPSLHEVRQTNFCRMAVRYDKDAGLVKIVSVIDNLVKGASGQAVQNMNVMFGFPEDLGLERRA